jgi:Zinc-finger associated domain (zf-AD)
METDGDDISDHMERCRMCLAPISECDVFYQLSEEIKIGFDLLTNFSLDLQEDRLSNQICADCHRNLQKFQSFHDVLVTTFDQLNRCLSTSDCEMIQIDNDATSYEYLQEEFTVECEDEEVSDEYLEEEVLKETEFSIIAPYDSTKVEVSNKSK